MAICVVGVVLITLGYMVGRTRMRCHVIVENRIILTPSLTSLLFLILSKSTSDLKAQIEKSSSELKAQIQQLDSKFSTFSDISLKATSERLIVEVDNLERRR